MSSKEKTMEEITANPIFKGQLVKFPKKIEGNHTITLVTDPQKYNFIHLDETGKLPKVTIKPIEGKNAHEVFVPSESNTFANWDIKHDSTQHFWTIKPQSESMTLNLDYGSKSIPLTLPQVFFEGNKPMHIFTSFLSVQNSTSTKNQLQEIISPAFSSVGFKQDDTYVFAEVDKDIVIREKICDGEYKLENVSEEFRRQLVKSLMTNTGGGIGQVVDNLTLLKEFFKGGSFYIKEIKGSHYVIFKGYAGHRKTLNGVKYSVKNPKVISLSIAQKGKGLPNAANATVAPFKEVIETGSLSSLKGTIVGLVMIGAVDYAYWCNEGILSENGKYLSDLLIDIGSDFVKGLIGSVIAGFFVGAVAAAIVGATAVTLPVVVIVGGTIVIGIAVGVGLDILDNEIGATDSIKKAGRKFSDVFSDVYYDFEDNIKALYFNMARISIP